MTGRIQPVWFANLNVDECVHMDVRPILTGGVDPLQQILVKVDLLSSDDILLIDAPFDPVPLRRMLGARGYESNAVPISDKHWRVFFKKQDTVDLPALPDISDLPPFPLYWHEGMLEMDLRKLEPPNPMIAILKVIKGGEGGDNFMVRLIRDPIYLYPELSEQNWYAETLEENEDGLKVRIYQGNKS